MGDCVMWMLCPILTSCQLSRNWMQGVLLLHPAAVVSVNSLLAIPMTIICTVWNIVQQKLLILKKHYKTLLTKVAIGFVCLIWLYQLICMSRFSATHVQQCCTSDAFWYHRFYKGHVLEDDDSTTKVVLGNNKLNYLALYKFLLIIFIS